MGGTGSTRRLTIETDGQATVTISEAVARRLSGLPDKDQAEDPVLPKPAPEVQEQKAFPTDTRGYIRDVNPEVEDFYVQKLKELQDRNEVLQKQTNDHFAKAVQEVEDKFDSYTASPVCCDLQAKVMECYQANRSEPLNCSSLVAEFTQCVDRARMAVSVSRVRSMS